MSAALILGIAFLLAYMTGAYWGKAHAYEKIVSNIYVEYALDKAKIPYSYKIAGIIEDYLEELSLNELIVILFKLISFKSLDVRITAFLGRLSTII